MTADKKALVTRDTIMELPSKYHVSPVTLPAEDRSGLVGARLLRLLNLQAERGLQWIRQAGGETTLLGAEFALPDGHGMKWPLHCLYNAATNAYVFAVLARLAAPDATTGGVSREQMEAMGRMMIGAVAETHPVSGSPKVREEWWRKWSALRLDHLFGMGAWLLWDTLTAETRLLVARILEHDADLYNQDKAPALLYDDTQAESNAWTGSGLALAYCMLNRHPRRHLWGEKAKEFMISAYATERDVSSDRLLDGKPLREWLRAPNAFADYTVENHGFIHPVYMAAISEMVRTAISYRLAGEPVPEATTFNAAHVLDALLFLNLPDGNHFYVQGSDYGPRRLDSFLQSCNVIPLQPHPLREACFLRVLESIEQMALQRPDMHMNGDVEFQFDFGTSWGLTENYLMRRLFGTPAESVPKQQIDASLAGVRVNEPGKFVIHRSPRTISSFSWHATDCGAQVMGMTMPLHEDILCYTPSGGGYIGDVVEAKDPRADALEVCSHHILTQSDGFSILLELSRCSGRLRQNCAFISLPDGSSVYVEQRTARQPVSIVSADSGSVWLYDDLRWPFQKQPRAFYSETGFLDSRGTQMCGRHWLNVDDHMGYVALGLEQFSLVTSLQGYRTWRLGFALPVSRKVPLHLDTGQTLGSFALISCPQQTRHETRELSRGVLEQGWQVNRGGVMALRVNSRIVFANFSERSVDCPVDRTLAQLPPQTAGWMGEGTGIPGAAREDEA